MRMLDFHQVGLGLFLFFSVLSLVLVVSKPVAREFEATALAWIRAFKRIHAEWRAPLTIEKPLQSPQLLSRKSSGSEHGS